MKKLFLILLLALALCACGKTEVPPEISPEVSPESESSSSEEEIPESSAPEEIPEEKPEFIFEKPEILYPENVPEELFESEAFKEAMERPSVILYDYEPISDCLAAVNFVEAAEKGEYAEFYIYKFNRDEKYSGDTLYLQHFILDKNYVQRKADSWQGWEKSKDLTENTVYARAKINDFGYFCLLDWDGCELSYTKVISDFALYENEAEHRALKEKYIDPIFTITVSPQEFSSVSDLSSDFVWLFEDIYNYENGHYPWQEFGNNWPLSEILSLLNRYFEGVTKEMVLISRRIEYDPETDTIFYEGGRGGVPPERRVFDFEQNGNILTLYYQLYNEENGTIFEDRYYVLEIKLLEDGSFRYLSQKIIERKP